MSIGAEPLAPDAKVSVPPRCKKNHVVVMQKIRFVIPRSIADGNPLAARHLSFSEWNDKDSRDFSTFGVEYDRAAVTREAPIPNLVFRIVQERSLLETSQVHLVDFAEAGPLKEKQCHAIGSPVPNAF